MAGEWIKMRGNLWDDPRVMRLCDLTDCGEAQVIGGLYWLWATADQHSDDGTMHGLTLRAIDRKTGIQGFGDALVGIGWVADHPEGIRIINFEEHNGASAKKRAQTAKRVANHKAGNAENTGSDDSGNAPSVTGALAQRYLEKRREEYKEEPNGSSAPSKKILLGTDGRWSGVSTAQRSTWATAYPALSLDAELSRAAAWILANPKNKKSNYARFLTNWLSRAQDKARPVGSFQPRPGLEDRFGGMV